MNTSVDIKLPADLAAELEAKYFWWVSVGSVPRSDARILAQAMDLASFEDIRRLETIVGVEALADFMHNAEPGWISERSWELWRGRLEFATCRPIPQRPRAECSMPQSFEPRHDILPALFEQFTRRLWRPAPP